MLQDKWEKNYRIRPNKAFKYYLFFNTIYFWCKTYNKNFLVTLSNTEFLL